MGFSATDTYVVGATLRVARSGLVRRASQTVTSGRVRPDRQVSESGHRFYNPNLGRWLSRDPSGEGQDKNIYVYVLNGPSRLVDPFGLTTSVGLPDRTTRLTHITIEVVGVTDANFYLNDADFDQWLNGLIGAAEGDENPNWWGATRTVKQLPVICDPELCDSQNECVKRKVEQRGSVQVTMHGRSNRRGDTGPSGRTTKEHEQEHLAAIEEWATRYNNAVVSLVGKCRSRRCDGLFRSVFDAYETWIYWDRSVRDWTNEVRDYTGGELTRANREAQSARASRTSADSAFNSAVRNYIASCGH
jgi:RHS repeat-associated protein